MVVEGDGWSLNEVARAQVRIERKLDSLLDQELVARLRFVEDEQKELKETMRWYGRWLLGIVGIVVSSGIVTYIAAVTR